jgi:predicted dithiol-disulfide oxidoreductase (DUF899 family)
MPARAGGRQTSKCRYGLHLTDQPRTLFEGRRQLIVYRAFFEPGVFGWPEHACRGCSLGADQVAHLAHLNARDTILAYASRASQADIARLKARMGLGDALVHTPISEWTSGMATTCCRRPRASLMRASRIRHDSSTLSVSKTVTAV